MMPKYTARLDLPPNDTRDSLVLSGVELDATDSDEAVTEFADYVLQNTSMERESVTYDVEVVVKVALRFELEDQDGDYEDAAELESAIERGDLDVTEYESLDEGEMTVARVTVSEQ